MSTNFGLKDGILIRTMTIEDYKDVKIFMKDHFYNAEPTIAAAGEDASKHMHQYSQENSNHISMIKEGTSLLATVEDNGERIVGMVIGGSIFASTVEEIRRKALEMEQCYLKHIMIFCTDAVLKANLFEKYGVSKLLYSSKTTVETSMRGKGLGTRLAAALMEVGRSKGFLLMAACCTSFYSARQKEALGMECANSQAYADYKDSNGQTVFNISAPHTHVRVMAIKL